ncbi:hypothetical protein BMI89_03215 [Thioclava sp. F36-7]|nr:hypothetical protein BMI89_03215 [Thioclava sp. F36-7]
MPPGTPTNSALGLQRATPDLGWALCSACGWVLNLASPQDTYTRDDIANAPSPGEVGRGPGRFAADPGIGASQPTKKKAVPGGTAF